MTAPKLTEAQRWTRRLLAEWWAGEGITPEHRLELVQAGLIQDTWRGFAITDAGYAALRGDK
jgi:hypothetical protein